MSTLLDPKQLSIKIPIYVSELIEKEVDLFGPATYPKMVSSIKTMIDAYDPKLMPITIRRKNKVSEKAIGAIVSTEVEILDRKSLLIQYTSYNTNYSDGFFEKDNKIGLTKKDKIGSDNNFMLLCPCIKNGGFSTESHWIILIYEDPNKENLDIISTAKALLSKILKIRVKNIKLNSAIQTIENAGIIENAIIRITTVETDPDNESILFKTHLVGSRRTVITESQYKNLPPESAIRLIKVESKINHYFKAVKKMFISAKKEIKIVQTSSEETNNIIKETVEEIYNTESIISEYELENCLYDSKFVLGKLTPVLIEYLSQVNEK